MPHVILCSADDLLGLIDRICGFRWDQGVCVQTISHLVRGQFPIYCDGKPMEEDLKIAIPATMQRFNMLLDDIYKGISSDAATWSMSQRWKMAAQIIAFGRYGGLSRADWGEALRKKI